MFGAHLVPAFSRLLCLRLAYSELGQRLIEFAGASRLRHLIVQVLEACRRVALARRDLDQSRRDALQFCLRLLDLSGKFAAVIVTRGKLGELVRQLGGGSKRIALLLTPHLHALVLLAAQVKFALERHKLVRSSGKRCQKL